MDNEQRSEEVATAQINIKHSKIDILNKITATKIISRCQASNCSNFACVNVCMDVHGCAWMCVCVKVVSNIHSRHIHIQIKEGDSKQVIVW